MKRLLIWGTGNIAKQVLSNGLHGDIIGFVETNKAAETFQNKKIYGIDEIPEEYDFIIVANTFKIEVENDNRYLSINNSANI